MASSPIDILRKRIEFVPLRWLIAATGLVLGLFVARVGYELWPGALAALVAWPVAPVIGLGAAALMVALYRWRGDRIGPSVFLPWLLLLLYVLQPAVNLLQALVLCASAAALSLMCLAQALGAQEWQLRWGGRAVLFVALLALYLPTMGQTVGKADTFEFQVVAPSLGVAHPTGYPLYLLLGKLFSLLPFGSVAWRVNLASVACALVAVGVLYSAIGQVLACANGSDNGQRLQALTAALALAASPVFWSQAIVAEVYALNAAFVTAMLWLALYGLGKQREAGWNARRWLFVLALVYGISLTNHLTMVLVAPVLALTVWWVRPQLSRLDWLKAAGLFVLGLSIYLYIPARWPALHNGQGMPLGEFVGWITGRQFGGALQPGLWRDPTRWRILARLLLEAFGPVGIALAGVGVVSLLFRYRRAIAITALAFVVYCAYALVYNVPDISVFLIPAHIIMAVWIGAGIFQITNFRFQIANLKFKIQNSGLPILNLKFGILNLLFILLSLSLMWSNLPKVDQSQAGQALVDWGRYVLSLPLPRGAAILADSEKIAPLYYLKSAEGMRSDIDMLVMGTEELYRAELDRRVAEGQPVYLARYLPGLAGVYRLHSVGPLVRVANTLQRTLPLTPIAQRLSISFRTQDQQPAGIRLLGYDLSPGQDVYHLTLYWQAQVAQTVNYHVRLRLVNESGLEWWQDPGTHPVSGYNPTAAWLPDEIIADYHEIPVGSTWPPGSLRLQVGLFLPFSEQGLYPVASVPGEPDAAMDELWYDVARIDLDQAEQPALPVALRANFGGQVLLRGASQPGVVPPGGRGEIVLEWEKLALAGEYSLYMILTPVAGQPQSAAQRVSAQVIQTAPFAGEYPLSHWQVGQPLQMLVRFEAPEQAGQYMLRVGWMDAEGRLVAARCGWMGQVAFDCPVTSWQVKGARQETGINLADQVILVKAQLGSQALRPGEKLTVNLRWQGLKVWPADYTAFVHLVGPDGKLYGQVDAYPVQGTLPTTQWQAGQIVDDPYTLTLAPNAPPGEYQVQVGWYLLATLRRLSVLDAAGHPIDDRVIIGRVTVAP